MGICGADSHLRERQNIRSVDAQFLVVPCRSVYNYIFGRPFATTLDAVASHALKDEISQYPRLTSYNQR